VRRNSDKWFHDSIVKQKVRLFIPQFNCEMNEINKKTLKLKP
jgi:hypothetical protein